MSVYNEKEIWLREAIESILNQTHRNIEFIITVDNPSNEMLYKHILSYNDSRIKIIRNDTNKGLIYSLNNALKTASGEYIARMDADDISDIYRLEKQLLEIKKEKLDMITSNIVRIDDDGNEIKYSHENIRKNI